MMAMCWGMVACVCTVKNLIQKLLGHATAELLKSLTLYYVMELMIFTGGERLITLEPWIDGLQA